MSRINELRVKEGGELIRKARKSLGDITQKELSLYIGCNELFIKELECGSKELRSCNLLMMRLAIKEPEVFKKVCEFNHETHKKSYKRRLVLRSDLVSDKSARGTKRYIR